MSAIKVMLTGGPSYVPESMLRCEVVDLGEPVKLCYGNGYEHFGFSGETVGDGDDSVAVFTWKGRTKIAE